MLRASKCDLKDLFFPKRYLLKLQDCMVVLHDDRGHINVDLDALMRQDASSVDVDLVADCDIVSQHTDVLQSCPFAYSRVPTNNSALDPGVVLDLGACEDDTTLQTDTIADNGIWANGNIGTDSAVLSDLRRGVDQDVAAVYIWQAGGSK
jgi:hypothetical protein